MTLSALETETPRLRSCLSRLLPHLDRDKVALTGGVALELYLAAASRPGRRQKLADIDFVASHLGAIAPAVANDFLVSHYHVAQQGVPKGMLQLVDGVTRLRLDVFADVAGNVPSGRRMSVAGEVVLVIDAQSLLDHKLQTLSKPPVDEKHWLDAVALAALCAAPVPPRPARFMPDRYQTDLALVCERCVRSKSELFPLAPKAGILALLGYV